MSSKMSPRKASKMPAKMSSRFSHTPPLFDQNLQWSGYPDVLDYLPDIVRFYAKSREDARNGSIPPDLQPGNDLKYVLQQVIDRWNDKTNGQSYWDGESAPSPPRSPDSPTFSRSSSSCAAWPKIIDGAVTELIDTPGVELIDTLGVELDDAWGMSVDSDARNVVMMNRNVSISPTPDDITYIFSQSDLSDDAMSICTDNSEHSHHDNPECSADPSRNPSYGGGSSRDNNPNTSRYTSDDS
ncbi:hypothetical protein M426DRAFT_265290 [Hypoxylon sp. CI-4A]|nr:hypothetical protein M426DRAFT_265290 [Hypoxylon sp. CI-4A]